MKKSVCFSALLNASISLITLQAMEAPKHVFIYVLILLLALGRLEGQEAERCDPRFCRLPDCYCGGSTIPGGYEPKDIPQFVLLTFDDAVNGLNQKFFDALFKNRNNPNGCPIKVFKSDPLYNPDTYMFLFTYTNNCSPLLAGSNFGFSAGNHFFPGQ